MIKFTLMLTIFLTGMVVGMFSIGAFKVPNPREAVEYQFFITDTMITVFDKDRVVGTVSLEGELSEMMIADNE